MLMITPRSEVRRDDVSKRMERIVCACVCWVEST